MDLKILPFKRLEAKNKTLKRQFIYTIDQQTWWNFFFFLLFEHGVAVTNKRIYLKCLHY